MKTSFKKLRGFAIHHKNNDPRDGSNRHHSTQLKQIAESSKDMQEMRDCYDKLLSAAATTTNSAYEFCESLGEMGTCFVERTGLSDDEDSGKLLKKLGKVQLELQKLMDGYRSHVVQTITIPSDSLLSELQTLEEMKRQCDEKRTVYEYMMMKQKEKAGTKGESFSLQQVQAAHEDYDVEATLFMFRLQSLKQGQSRSLLTQASRHHAAQLHFFKKALKFLEEVDPDVWAVTERMHIDYHFTGLDENEGEGGNDNEENDCGDCGDDTRDGVELSFNYRKSDSEQIKESTTITAAETLMERVDKGKDGSFVYVRERTRGVQSAPLSIEKQSDSIETVVVQPWVSPRNKPHTYVLPTPDTRTATSKHSTSTEKKKTESISGDDTSPVKNVPPLYSSSYSKEIQVQLQSFSDPLEKCTNPGSWSDFQISSKRKPQLPAGSILPNRSSFSLSSPRSSMCASPSLLSPLKIGELHELPRPPSFGRKTTRNASFGHSAPLFPSNQHGTSAPRKSGSTTASPLPEPPQSLSRSFSIPTSSQRMAPFQVSQPFDCRDKDATEMLGHSP